MIQPMPPAAPVLTVELDYAGFWRRAAAYLIDSVLLGGVELMLATSAFVLAGNDIHALANVSPVSAAIAWAYFAIFESSPARGTPGKLAFGLSVGDVHGDPITFRRASVRNALKAVSWLVLGLGFVLAAFTPRKQALHDLLAGTLVLRKVRHFSFGDERPTEAGEYWDGVRWTSVVPAERS